MPPLRTASCHFSGAILNGRAPIGRCGAGEVFDSIFFGQKNLDPTNSEFVRTGYRLSLESPWPCPQGWWTRLPISALFLMTIPLFCTNAPISYPFDYVASSHQSPVNSVGVNPLLCIRLRGGWRESRFGGSRPLSVGKKTSLTMFPGGDRSRDPLRREVS